MSEVKDLKKVSVKNRKFAVSELIAMPRLWMAKGPRELATVLCQEARSGNLWLEPQDAGVPRIHEGRRFKVIQTLEVDTEYPIVVQAMVANPAVSEEDLGEIEAEFGIDSTAQYREGLAEKYTQLHFMAIVEEDEE